ncbi:MAG: 30S ribosomal protein S17, partial [Limisphaerales bacterium]
MSDTTTPPSTPPAPSAAVGSAPSRSGRKERIGEVIANKMTKTIIVRVERRFPHPRFK